MAHNWKPGDVAMVRLDPEREIRVMYTDAGWVGRKGPFYDLQSSARPLAVIDPDSDADVARMENILESLGCRVGSAVPAALREFANPWPPKPYIEAYGPCAPWPVVGECFSSAVEAHECPQCAWEHEHKWVAWTNPRGPEWPPNAVPIRCAKCGGRKCDQDDCPERRHSHTHHASEGLS